jgi:glycosyltransferase involved in cell wall biosynthesis
VFYLEYGPKDGEEKGKERIFRMLRDLWDLRRALANTEAAIVLINTSLRRNSLLRDAVTLLMVRLMGRRYMVFVRGWQIEFENAIKSSWFWMRLLRLAYFRAEGMIVLATRFRQALESWGFDGRIELETTTVPDELFDKQHASGALLDDSWETKGVNLVYFSRLEKEKGVYIVLEAFESLQRMYPFLKLRIAGEGPEGQGVRDYVKWKQMEGVEFFGYVRGCEKRRLLRKGDVFVFPSSYGEGMPNALLEAMARGMVILTRPVGGISDFFEDGRMGFITESTEAGDFARLAGKCIEDQKLRNSIGAYNREYADKHFRASIVAKRLLRITSEVGRAS